MSENIKIKKGDVLGWTGRDECGCRWVALDEERIQKTATCDGSDAEVGAIHSIAYLSKGIRPTILASAESAK